jgi:regulator-associated protein of mTOR
MSLKCFLLILLSLKTTDDADDAAGHKSFICASMQTGFCDWSARYFAQPVMKVSA